PFEVIPCGSLSQNLLESELFGYRKGSFSGADEDRKGIFERANGGTVFLDEVADMTMEMQQKLLRVLQEQMVRPIGAETPVRVDVRVISSSQRELSALVDSRGFREDLFYRLNGFTLEVPPLRERREDIPLLIDHFLAEACDENDLKKRFSESALRELYQYSWPGNVQELCNVITRSILSSPRKIISRKVVLPLLSRGTGNLFYGEDLFQDGDHLHLRIPTCEGFNEIITECERLILVTALKRHRGNKSRVTQQLGIPRQTLYNKLEKFAVGEEEYLETE
ncbi:MAG: sigma 54-interacting transcriptional regulator, partial [Planctomycetota bacterium]